MTGSAASLISDAEAFGIILEVRGDKLRCGSSATMPPALRDMLREHKPGIVKELLRRASSGSEPRAVKSGPHVIEGNASGVAAAPDRPARMTSVSRICCIFFSFRIARSN